MNTREEARLAIVLRCLGLFDMLALVAVVMPHSWMNFVATHIGLETLPSDPVFGYLARSAAMMYALHGLTVVYVSFDVRRYWPLIRFLALVALVHGVVILGIDLVQRMPLWWRLVEGPCFSMTGLVVWLLVRPVAAGASRHR